MKNNTTIREYIELQQRIFGLSEDTYNKIKVKISRELQLIDDWNSEDIDKKKAGRTKAYILDTNIIEKLEKKMRPYFMKQANINKEAFENEKVNNEIKAQSLDSEYHTSTKDDTEAYIYDIPKIDKLYVMIEALFSEKFELDEEAWRNDYSTYNIFLTDSEAMVSDSLALTTLRLKNPLKHYVKKCENSDDKK